MKCKYCGNEITNPKRTVFCSPDCAYNYSSDVYKIKNLIKTFCRRYNFDVKNADKIISAKIRFFHNGNVKRCPCDGNNPDRYCGSPLCMHDILEYGHCHCSLFWRKYE